MNEIKIDRARKLSSVGAYEVMWCDCISSIPDGIISVLTAKQIVELVDANQHIYANGKAYAVKEVNDFLCLDFWRHAKEFAEFVDIFRHRKDDCQTMKTIVGVNFQTYSNSDRYNAEEYLYYAEEDLKVGDKVFAPTQFGVYNARVCRVGVDASEIKSYSDRMRTVSAIRPNELAEPSIKEGGNRYKFLNLEDDIHPFAGGAICL